MKRPSLTTMILIGLVAGIAFGAEFPAAGVKMGLLGDIFLRLIKSIIAPLLFGTLVSGIASTGSVKTMGRIGGKAILYFRDRHDHCPVRRIGRGEFDKARCGSPASKRRLSSGAASDELRTATDPGAHRSR